MSITTAINQITSPSLKSTSRTQTNAAAAAAASAATSDAAAGKETGFSNALTQATSTIPSKALSAEVLAATVPSTTLQTSSYVFDPLGVVGTIPESNVFLQAIRQMMGKPAEALAAPATPATPPTTTPVTAAVLTPSTTGSQTTSFNALPAASSALLATASTTTAAAADTSTTDFLNSLEAQLNYQNLGSTTSAETALMDALEPESEREPA